MGETRLMDCPKCGRTNVLGYKKEDESDKWGKVIVTGGAAIIGGLLGGPIGAGIGLAGGKMLGDRLADSGEGSFMYFQFQCPACGHRWVESFKK